MTIRTSVVGLLVAATTILTAPAAAAPSTPDVRVEGYTQTLFEGPVRTDGHTIRASSDTADRPCDGTNLGANPEPGPTATAATVDAMTIIGQTFDGAWYPGFEDYFIQRWGPDAEDANANAYWGVLVNAEFIPVGGCQFRVDSEDDVLWAADAFNARPFLRLAAATTEVAPGASLGVTVTQTSGGMDGAPLEEGPTAGALVAPVITAPVTGYQTVAAGDPAAVTTNASGDATLSWSEPGWKRVKAVKAEHVRSNRLDVCVTPCGPAPPDTLVREPGAQPTPSATPTATVSPTVTASPTVTVSPTATSSPTATASPSPTTGPSPSPTPSSDPTASPGPSESATPSPSPSPQPTTAPEPTATASPSPTVGPPTPGPVRVAGLAAVERKGRVEVSWRIADPGVGVRRWRVQSRAKKRGWVTRATGTTATSARLRLPPGREHRLRFTITDTAGRAATTPVGRVLVPIDDRSQAMRYSGRWSAIGLRDAWAGTASVGKKRARVRVRLPAGRPVMLVRGPATVRFAGARYRVRGGAIAAVVGRKRRRAGVVSMRVLRGKARVDGAAVRP